MRNYLLMFLFVSVIDVTMAQLPQPLASIPGPSAASLGLYTDFPVSHFTGIPSIQIPLYEITEGNVTVPITLSYHPAAVRVHSRPSWVGLGWDLQAGGAITRTVNGKIDEYAMKLNTPYRYSGFISTYSLLNGTDTEWYSSARLNEYRDHYVPRSLSKYEAMPDEFSFNFLGYSGKFYMGHDGQWKVVSDQDIKVICDLTQGQGFIEEGSLPEVVKSRILRYESITGYFTGTYLDKFTIVTPDGVKYLFGGGNAVEYSVHFRRQEEGHPISTAFYLSKIILPTGQEINFNYQRGDLVASLSKSYVYSSTNRTDNRWFGVDCGSTTGLQLGKLDGTMTFPVYLTSITNSTGGVNFTSSVTNDLRLPNTDVDNEILYQENGCDMSGTGREVIPFYFYGLCETGTPYTSSFGEQLKWRKLDNISAYHYMSSSYYIRKWEFTYLNTPSSRLKLLELKEKNPSTNEGKPSYFFTYNSRSLPAYGELKSNDHWDYYNGFEPANFPPISQPISTFNTNFFNAREPDPTGQFSKAEILEKMQLPTGGFITYDYEPHTYAKLVDRQNPGLPVISIAGNRIAGGLRIRKISAYDAGASTPSLVKEYYYVKDYVAGGNPSTMVSSGILGGLPKYYWPNFTAKDKSNANFTYTVFSSGSLLPFGMNTAGNHLGYSEVVEVVKNPTDASTNGYTKFKFSNFDTDIWGTSHLDEIGVTNDPDRSIYSPQTTRERERGILLSKEFFASNQLQPVQKTTYQYAATSSGFVRRVLQESMDICTNVTEGAQICFVTAFKTYLYRYNLISQQTTEYDGANTLVSTINYEYTPQNFINKTITSNSDGTTSEVQVRYPLDLTTAPTITQFDWEAIGLSKLIEKNMINTPIETIEKRNGNLVRAKLTGFKLFGTNVFAHKQWTVEANEPLQIGGVIGNGVNTETNKFNPAGVYLSSGNYYFRRDEHYTNYPVIFSNYDNRGNVLEAYQQEGIVTSYLWAYSSTRPVAEIEGASYSQLPSVIGGYPLSTFGDQYFGNETELRTAINGLRATLPNAFISSATYRYFGITSKTDQNGRHIFYEYDGLGRLLRVKDHTGNILQTYKYVYGN